VCILNDNIKVGLVKYVMRLWTGFNYYELGITWTLVKTKISSVIS
jgi:hypothetical protein